jgi:signal transduction histidine kinase
VVPRLFLALAILFARLPAQAATGDTALHLTSAEVLAVEGKGFSPPPYSQTSDTLQGQWTPVTLPHIMPSHLASAGGGGPPLTVATWYRARVEGAPPGENSQHQYLYVPRWKTDGQIAIYGDGRLLYQSHANLMWNGSNHPLWVPLDGTTGTRIPREILIRIERLRATGGALSSLWVGGQDELGWRYRTREWLQAQLPFMSSTAFLAVGCFSLLVWCMRRRETLYLLFFAVSAISFLRTMHYYAGQERLPVSDEWFGWVTVNSVFWLLAAVHLFLERLHRQPRPWLTRTLLATSLAVGLATLPVSEAMPNATVFAPVIYGLILVLSLGTLTLNTRSALRARSVEAMLLAGWSLFSLVLGLCDWLLQNNLVDVEWGFPSSYANVGAFVLYMFIMFRRYVGAIAGMEELNASLEARLQAREAELSASHERLRRAEHHQTLAQERQRMMQDMHDGLGSSLRSALWAVERGKIGEPGAVAEVLKSCIDDLKLAIDSMEPVESDLLLLLATLRYRLGSRLETTGLELSWEISDVPPLPWLDPRSSLHILRILQEVFTNIIKHTQASHVSLTTAVEHDCVVVGIRDNGCGFDVEAALRGGGHGLSNQVRRAQAIGCTLAWKSDADGTLVSLRLPLAPAPSADAEPAAAGDSAQLAVLR